MVVGRSYTPTKGENPMTESYRARILSIDQQDAYYGHKIATEIIGKVGTFYPWTGDTEYNTTLWAQEGYLAGEFVSDIPDSTEKDLYTFYAVKLERLEE
jgi:hypothetical protein